MKDGIETLTERIEQLNDRIQRLESASRLLNTKIMKLKKYIDSQKIELNNSEKTEQGEMFEGE
jgi:chaperonin cofactor prefoldin